MEMVSPSPQNMTKPPPPRLPWRLSTMTRPANLVIRHSNSPYCACPWLGRQARPPGRGTPSPSTLPASYCGLTFVSTASMHLGLSLPFSPLLQLRLQVCVTAETRSAVSQAFCSSLSTHHISHHISRVGI
ncbi:hypothetical protein CC85DRAFT_137637 [Cutaneotrichosporon oleaginosum]|uniref:Uncharacterized protein n=1 Tax=Cutaneotrichosporon oleaginosum TaxID=879819 RepID=A0A0J0XWX2_9TREE|nr:uncharacterized protein CC85DRAFT_137637 [Cutaneotrichosporon oleaginosum]KLT45567.1 hypothetical protein CC85DRAFT_137637 [Cutaneotrichosporon oleaginosum]TXT14480.1 hypothetical protein COLE_00673 [Cutaneotrichosporon oleaginosum]